MRTTITQLKKAAANYPKTRARISATISTLNPVEIVTPTNVKAEKERWIEHANNGEFINPTFEYNQELIKHAISKRPDLEILRAELEATPAPDDLAEQFILEHLIYVVNDGINTTRLAKAIKNGDDEKAAAVILEKYGFPSEENIEGALEIVQNNKLKNLFEHEIKQNHPYPKINIDILSDTKRKLKASEIKDMFEWTMKNYPAESWQVVIDDNCTSIDVRDKSAAGHPVIVIPSKRKVTGMKLAELIGHEIECHWRSSINAELIGALKCDDELVYEGFAALKDKAFNRKYLESFNLNSAYYITAIAEAKSGKSFAEVGKIIYDLLPDCIENKAEKAWLYTSRVFRGITNSENPEKYAFTKDRAYFEGWRYAGRLEDKGKAAFLSFSTLDQKSFERLMELIDVEDVKANTILDRDIQTKSLEKILKCLTYNGAN